ncbi:MAG: hypothetical protein Q7R47_01115, partial [Candidatus Diapherotrites archaeon]|nr:hypothetical protein [Candidatus Diapherotrites archaeon]
QVSVGYYRNPITFDPSFGPSKHKPTPDFAIEIPLNPTTTVPEAEIFTKNAVTAIGDKIGVTTKTNDPSFDQKIYIPGTIAPADTDKILNSNIRALIVRFPCSFVLQFVPAQNARPSRLRYMDNGFRPINSVPMFQQTLGLLVDIAEELEK